MKEQREQKKLSRQQFTYDYQGEIIKVKPVEASSLADPFLKCQPKLPKPDPPIKMKAPPLERSRFKLLDVQPTDI